MNNPNEKTVEEMLEKILLEKNFSQKELACELNVDPAQVSRWLNESAKPRRATASKIKQIYNELTA